LSNGYARAPYFKLGRNIMGVEIRRVPPNWEHPRDSDGNYQPLYNSHYHEEALAWIDGFNSFKPDKYYQYYWEYDIPPDSDYCVPYAREEATWYQVYETVSEGTPVTPPFETEDELIDYLVTKGTFWDDRGYERLVAEKFVKEIGCMPSVVFKDGKFYAGIEACEIF
jgi:hypothetical protein